MKRLTAYALTAAAALATAGTIPSTANAAVNTYNFSAGGGRVIMVTGNNRMDFNNILNQIPGVNFSPDSRIIRAVYCRTTACRCRSCHHRITQCRISRTIVCRHRISQHRSFRTTAFQHRISRPMKIRMRPWAQY